MTDTDRAIAEIRAALDDPALTDEGAASADTWWACYRVKLACTIPNVRALLARLDERDAEVERLRGELDDCINVLPNTAYYLDPPDGGSVTIAEQLRRMGEDAARYRWLRGGPAHYESALAEVERLRDDAERYRWLRRRADEREDHQLPRHHEARPCAGSYS